MERRFQATAELEIETREDGTATVGGYAAVFHRANDAGTEYGLWEGASERIMPGAFDRALSEGDDVRALFNHDANVVLGRTSAGTLRLSTNRRGLRYDVDLPDTQAATDLAKSISRGDINGSSFGFIVEDEAWRKEGGQEIREVRGVRLFDVGPVVFPAYASATAGVRSEDARECRSSHEAWKAAIEAESEKEKEEVFRRIETMKRRARLAEID